MSYKIKFLKVSFIINCKRIKTANVEKTILIFNGLMRNLLLHIFNRNILFNVVTNHENGTRTTCREPLVYMIFSWVRYDRPVGAQLFMLINRKNQFTQMKEKMMYNNI